MDRLIGKVVILNTCELKLHNSYVVLFVLFNKELKHNFTAKFGYWSHYASPPFEVFGPEDFTLSMTYVRNQCEGLISLSA